MIKSLNKSDVTVRPFKTFKRWQFQNIDPDDVLLTEFRENISIDYSTGSGGLELYSSSLAPEDQEYFDERFHSAEGMNISGTFFPIGDKYYTTSSNPVNWDDSYKRIIYSTIKQLYYNNFNNPLSLHGVEYADTESNGKYEIRNIHNRIMVGTTPYKVFGEKIRPLTVRLTDNSYPHEQIFITDDGYTNLNTDGEYFLNDAQRISPYVDAYYKSSSHYFYNPEFDRFGSNVKTFGPYILVGSPMDSESFSNHLAGETQLFKYDVTESRFRFCKNLFSPWSQNGCCVERATDNSQILMTELGFFLIPEITQSVQDSFGSALSINGDFIAIGAPFTNFAGDYNGQGHVFVYDKYKGGVENWGICNILQGSQSNDQFGCSVCISGSVLAVGARNARGGKGAVYIYRKEIAGETVPTSSLYLQMFYEELRGSLHLDDEDDPSIFSEDVVPTFVQGNNIWVRDYVITASDGQIGDGFGGEVKIDGNRILVGGLSTSLITTSSVVYLFEQHTSGSWVASGSYYNVDDENYYGINGYGSAEWQSGSWVRGTYGQTYRFSAQGIYSGSVFTSHSIDLIGNLTFAGTPAVLVTSSFNGFGQAIAIRDDLILISAPYGRKYYEYVGATILYSSGEVFAFNRQSGSNEWKLAQVIYGEMEDSTNNIFGYNLDVNKDRFVIGSVPYPDDHYLYYVSGSSSYYADNFIPGSDGPENVGTDQEYIAGRVFLYEKSTDSMSLETTWSLEKIIKRYKQQYDPKLKFGLDVAIGDNDILAVGAPLVLLRDTSSITSSIYTDQNILRYNIQSNSFQSLSGSVFIYPLDELGSYQIGNVFYKNGTFVLTNTGSIFYNVLTELGPKGYQVEFNGTHTIQENEVLCQVEAGEFNVSTNPTSTYGGRILFDINGDGLFDYTDLWLIMNFLIKKQSYKEIGDNNAINQEQRNLYDKGWWFEDIVIAESGDPVLLVPPDLTAEIALAEQLAKEKEINDYLQWLLDNGYLDVDLNGLTDKKDAQMILNYYYGIRGYKMIEGLITNNSQRQFASEIIDYLDEMTGKYHYKKIKEEFLNYSESSSLDPTGSYLAPYCTTIGLYSGLELVAVAKLGQPIKISSDYPVNFMIKWDN